MKLHAELLPSFPLHFSKQSLSNGLIAIVDAQKCSWRMARDQIKFISQLLDRNLIKLFAIRTEAFSMQNCAKSYKKGEVRSLREFPGIVKLNPRHAFGFVCNWINSIMLMQLNIPTANFPASLCAKWDETSPIIQQTVCRFSRISYDHKSAGIS